MLDQELELGNFEDIQADSFEPVPAGFYCLRAVDMELKDTKTGGKMLKVQFDITEGQYEGRKVFENFNIVNSNPQAVEIALKSIKQWMQAAGMDTSAGTLKLSDIAKLEGVKVWAKVGIEKDKTGEYDDDNTIKRFLTADKAPTGAAMIGTGKPAASAPQSAAPVATGKKAWEQ